jgi:hypothetical protein
MLEENKEAFEQFQRIHNQYVLSPHEHQEKFNQIGMPIMELIKKYENKLCNHCEKGMYAQFSSNLAEKFWELVRKEFSQIDFVGVKRSIPTKEAQDAPFEIKKISLLQE